MDSPPKPITILSRGPNHIVVYKPPSVLCHHSYGSWKKKEGKEREIPMLQLVRDAIDQIDNDDDKNEEDEGSAKKMKRRVNLVHRLDRGASGALLFAFADESEEKNIEDEQYDKEKEINKNDNHPKGPTAILQEEMGKSTTIKTYVALVRGEGILRGEDLKARGWFDESRPIKDHKGKLYNATTSFKFICGQKSDGDNEQDIIKKPRMSIVLARPQHGRWHQIRRHLNGLSSHILGDGTHGCSKTNNEWKSKRNMPKERVFLHLARLQIPSTNYTPEIDCSCPLPRDMLLLLKEYGSDMLDEAIPVLKTEGIIVDYDENYSLINDS